MTGKQWKRVMMFVMGGVLLGAGACVYASSTISGVSLGGVASTVRGSMANIAKLITAGAYVAGFGLAVAALAKFKAHKDQPAQVPISQPIALLFVGAALVFLPAVLKSTGATLYSGGGISAGTSGISNLS